VPAKKFCSLIAKNYGMEKTCIWLGKDDIINLSDSDLKQIGVGEIVMTLRHILDGKFWTVEEVLGLKQYIENAGLLNSSIHNDTPEMIRIFTLYPKFPMQVNHDSLMLSDIDKYNPDYSLERMHTFAEVSEMIAA
jgi:D-mannonate dehydratase